MNIHDYIEKAAASKRQLRMIGVARENSKKLGNARFKIKAPDSVRPQRRKAYEDQMNQRAKDLRQTRIVGKNVYQKHTYGRKAARAFAQGDVSRGNKLVALGRRARNKRDKRLNAIKDPKLRRQANFMFKRGPLPERLRRKK